MQQSGMFLRSVFIPIVTIKNNLRGMSKLIAMENEILRNFESYKYISKLVDREKEVEY